MIADQAQPTITETTDPPTTIDPHALARFSFIYAGGAMILAILALTICLLWR